ncbi:hypothetical protein PC116_g18212 [Phytophthora cactorum]|nr:hypothetical protein PC116_g18212 [Phytophthora cactorum]
MLPDALTKLCAIFLVLGCIVLIVFAHIELNKDHTGEQRKRDLAFVVLSWFGWGTSVVVTKAL